MARSGYTLPVFAGAAAIAACRCLQGKTDLATVSLDLVTPPETAAIAIEQVARLHENAALAIARSDPGDNLDLTRHTPVWALVEWQTPPITQAIAIQGGEGIGKHASGKAAIYRYARTLLQANLQRELAPGTGIRVTIVLPEGRRLAERTSNAAFGIVEGLSLLGTSGISQPLSAPEQLDAFRAELSEKASRSSRLVFCIGENGLDLARQLGIPEEMLLKTANWLGPLLVEAGQLGVSDLLLFGYHGKLIKLAGGIFHTHHHLADARLEILAAYGIRYGLPAPVLPELLACATLEDAWQRLQVLTSPETAADFYQHIASAIDTRARNYIRASAERDVRVGSVLFDRRRKIVASSENGRKFLAERAILV